LRLNPEVLAPGRMPRLAVQPGSATTIATGASLPRGADAVVMVEQTEVGGSSEQPELKVLRAVTAGEQVAFAGTDVAQGETVLRAGQVLTSREIGVLAAIGLDRVAVYRRPVVAIISTGNEIVAPGQPRPPGAVYDSNAAILSAAVQELGAVPLCLGSIADDEPLLEAAFQRAQSADLIVLSGGTSKGAGDLSYRVVSRLTDPGIVAHGVALKPGKPICLAVSAGKAIVVLPGFPTSAIFTFHEFVAPVIRALGGRPVQRTEAVEATLPLKVNSERGRTEYLLVGLVRTEAGLAAYPMGKGSGSVTTYSSADGFITIPQQTEMLAAGSTVKVQLLGHQLQPADLVVIGSHCVGLDYLVGEVQRRSLSVRLLNVGSMGGLAAAKRGECDLAGIHLMDAETGVYNRPFLTAGLELLDGYRRMQGIVYRLEDPRFEGRTVTAAIAAALADENCTMVNRNAGSGTRILIDRLLAGAKPPGYPVQAKSHNAVATSVAQGRADWGVAIDTVARQYRLGFLPLQEEHYDFVVPRARWERPAVKLIREILAEPAVREHLAELGFRL
jgi:putative molybdopterin biosynthesis protein